MRDGQVEVGRFQGGTALAGPGRKDFDDTLPELDFALKTPPLKRMAEGRSVEPLGVERPRLLTQEPRRGAG